MTVIIPVLTLELLFKQIPTLFSKLERKQFKLYTSMLLVLHLCEFA